MLLSCLAKIGTTSSIGFKNMLFMIGLKDPIQNWLKILNLSQINVDKRGLVRDEKTKAHKVTRKKQTKGIIW